MMESKCYVKMLRRESNKIIDVLNNTSEVKRAGVLENEIERLKGEFGADLLDKVTEIGKVRLIK